MAGDLVAVDAESGEVLELPAERRHIYGHTVTVTGVHSAADPQARWLGRVTLDNGALCIPWVVGLRILERP